MRASIIASPPLRVYVTQDATNVSLARFRRRLRSLSRSRDIRKYGPGTIGTPKLSRENKQQHRLAKEGIGVKSDRKIKQRRRIVNNVVRRLLSLPDKVQHCGFSLCSGGGGAIPLPASGYSRLNFGPDSAPGRAVLDRVSRCKADMLVMKAHTTYYGFPSPSEIKHF